jgi:hypothetical protein
LPVILSDKGLINRIPREFKKLNLEDPRWRLGHSHRPCELREPGTLLTYWGYARQRELKLQQSESLPSEGLLHTIIY